MSPKSSRSKNPQTILACTVCQQRNYTTHKTLAVQKDRLTLKKYCPQCGQHQMHQETK